MNILYAILMNGAHATGNYVWYDKHHNGYIPTARMQAIRDIITQGVDEKLPLLACQICSMVLYTQFGQQIKELDPNNSYVDTTRPVDADHNDSKYCLYDVIKSVSAYQNIRNYLDDDIAAVLDKESWLDIVAAGCLQMLREATL